VPAADAAAAAAAVTAGVGARARRRAAAVTAHRRRRPGATAHRAVPHQARGRPVADRAALADVLVKVSALAWTLRERIAELDINPLVVRADGEGVVALDALLVLRG